MAQTAGLQSDVEGMTATAHWRQLAMLLWWLAAKSQWEAVFAELLSFHKFQVVPLFWQAVGLGGRVAVADYAGSVTAKIKDNTRIDNTTGVTVGGQSNQAMVLMLTCQW